MVGSFVRFFFTRCEESLNSLVRCAHSFAPLATPEEKSSALTNHEVTSIYYEIQSRIGRRLYLHFLYFPISFCVVLPNWSSTT